MNYPEVDFPILLSELYEFVRSAEINAHIVQKIIANDVIIMNQFMGGAFDGVPGLSREQVFFLWTLIVDTCYDIKIDIKTAGDFVAEITDILRNEPRVNWGNVLIGFTDAPAPLIGRKD